MNLSGWSLLLDGIELAIYSVAEPVIVLPSGETVYCPALGPVGHEIVYTLVERYRDDAGAPAFHSNLPDSDPVFDGQKVVVTANYSKIADIVPTTITPLQVRLALNQSGLRAQVNAYVATLSQDEQDKWEYATTIERTNATLVAGTAALGMSPAQVDQLFQTASTLL